MRPHHTPLRIEHLEDRSLPSANMPLGTPWPDASALSLSFAPDDTPIGSRKSELFKALDKVSNKHNWQREILQAFQSWAVHSNINLSVVKDNRDPFGVTGDTQGDTRFGDIRVGATALAADSLANVSPYDWSIGTWSGDVLLNTASRFALNAPAGSTAHDLYTVLLHEAGHVFGLDHSDDPASAMTARYAGPKLGPAAGDVIALQSIYGERLPDAYEGAAGNDTLGTAYTLVNAGTNNLTLTGDVTTQTDVDFYKLTVPAGVDRGFEVRLRTAGLSSLVPTFTLFDANGRPLSTKTGSDPLSAKDLNLKVDDNDGRVFYLRVAGATNDVFSVGRYELQVNYRKTTSTNRSTFDPDGGRDDTIVTATDFPKVRPNAARYAANGVIESGSDQDFYRLTAPAGTSGTADALTVQVRTVANKGEPVAPLVTVYDASGTLLPVQVLAYTGTRLTVQLPGVQRGATYYIRVATPNTADTAQTGLTGLLTRALEVLQTKGPDQGTGNYRLTAAFGPLGSAGMDLLQTANLSADARSLSGTLTVENGRLFQFALLSTGDQGGSTRLSVMDAKGKELFSLSQTPNQKPATGQVYLPTGTYTLTVTRVGGPGDLRFWLLGGIYSDPIGPYAPGTGGSTVPPTSPPPLSPPPPPPPPPADEVYADDSGYWYTPYTLRPPIGYYYMF